MKRIQPPCPNKITTIHKDDIEAPLGCNEYYINGQLVAHTYFNPIRKRYFLATAPATPFTTQIHKLVYTYKETPSFKSLIRTAISQDIPL